MYICVTHNALLNISKRSKPAKLTVQGELEFLFFNSYWQIVTLCLTSAVPIGNMNSYRKVGG